MSFGYLEYDRKTQTYLPTMRIAVLGRWVSEQLFSGVRMLPLMEDLRDRTRETVIVGTQSDVSAQYVHVLRSNQTISYSAEPGSLRPLARCGGGLTLLSNKSDADIDSSGKFFNMNEMDREIVGRNLTPHPFASLRETISIGDNAYRIANHTYIYAKN